MMRKAKLERFFSHLGEPVREDQSEQAIANVLERLRSADASKPLHVLSLPKTSARTHRPIWIGVAAAAVLMVAGAFLHVALLRFGMPIKVAAVEPLHSEIESGRILRASENGGLLTLDDGSRVEMGPMAELSVVRVSNDVRVRLSSGTVLITAAKQKEGHHLYVETKDCLISVVGTVFQVNAEKSGSRISVIEGEVHVQRGEISQTLIAGQQASTSPELGPLMQEVPVVRPPKQESVAALVQTPPPAAVQNETTGNVIHGVVKNAVSGEGIADVTVSACPSPFRYAVDGGRVLENTKTFFALWDSKHCDPDVVKTDSTGSFRFTNLGDGNYTVTAERDGYLGPVRSLNAQAAGFKWNTGAGYSYSIGLNGETSVSFFRRPLNGDRAQVTVNAQQRTADVSLSLLRGNLIQGHVRDADGRPVSNAVVRIVARTAGTASDGPTVTTALTDKQGQFRAYGLAPGDYRVGATVPTGLPGGEVWYSRTTNPSEVTVVTLKDGGEVSDVDIVIPRPQI
jgi:ferric-dicitrate binding protein FerR (iron transport regulator)